MGPQGVLGIWGEWLFIFRELGSTGNYFRGAREQAHNFGDLGSLAKKQKKIRKSLHFLKKNSSATGGLAPQTPLVTSKCNMLIKVDLGEIWQLSFLLDFFP